MPPLLTSLKTRLALLFGKLSHGSASLTSRLKIPSFQGSSHTLALDDPERITKWLGYLLVLMCAWLVLYSLMRIAQLPWPAILTPQAAQGSKGMTLYGSQEVQSASALFGSKPLELGNLQLRGVVITGKTEDGKETGFALLEIDGKPSGAVALGENLGKGLVLQAIRPEGVTIVHQGQKMDLTLNRSPAKKVNPPPKPSSSNNPSSTSPSGPAASDANKANPS